MSDQNEYERNLRSAEREHDLTNDVGKRLLDAAVKDAQEAIKVVLLLNSGSAVAVLAFIGTVISKNVFSLGDLQSVVNTLYWFFGGTIAAGFTSACAYFSNRFYSSAHFYTSLSG